MLILLFGTNTSLISFHVTCHVLFLMPSLELDCWFCFAIIFAPLGEAACDAGRDIENHRNDLSRGDSFLLASGSQTNSIGWLDVKNFHKHMICKNTCEHISLSGLISKLLLCHSSHIAIWGVALWQDMYRVLLIVRITPRRSGSRRLPCMLGSSPSQHLGLQDVKGQQEPSTTTR